MTEMYEVREKTQTDRILDMLQVAGNRGVRNYELMKISYQYPYHIWKLRHKHGLVIESKRVSGSEWRVTLHQTAPVQTEML